MESRWQGEIEARLTGVESDARSVEARLSRIEATMAAHGERLARIEAKIERIASNGGIPAKLQRDLLMAMLGAVVSLVGAVLAYAQALAQRGGP